MNNFIITVLLCAGIFYLTQKNPVNGFMAFMILVLMFVYFTVKQVTEDDVKYRQKMISNPKSRKIYYQDINSDS